LYIVVTVFSGRKSRNIYCYNRKSKCNRYNKLFLIDLKKYLLLHIF